MSELLEFTLNAALIVLAISLLLVFIRLFIGPSLPDRVIAMDLMTTIGIGIIGLYSIIQDEPIFIDVAIIIALLAFLGTIAFAYYLELRGKR